MTTNGVGLSAAAVEAAASEHPESAILVLPREDGQYSTHCPDVLGILREATVPAAYATDPMASGEHAEKSADIVLPVLFIIGTVSNWATTVDGVIAVANYFIGRISPKGTVRLRAAYHRSPEGEEFGYIELDLPGDADPTEAIRTALDRVPRANDRRARKKPR